MHKSKNHTTIPTNTIRNNMLAKINKNTKHQLYKNPFQIKEVKNHGLPL
jgi:hypothetical protein